MLRHFHGLYSMGQENMGFSEMRGGMNMCRTLYLKMRITGCCEILVYKQTMKLRLGDWIYWSCIDQKREQLQHYRRDNYGQWNMEGCKQKRMSTEKNTKISQEKIKRCEV